MQLTLPFTEILAGFNALLWLVDRPADVETIEFWGEKYLTQEFGPRPKASEE